MRADITLSEADYLAANRAHAMLLLTNGSGLIFPATMAVLFWGSTLLLRKPDLAGALVELGSAIVWGALIWVLLTVLTQLTLKRRTRHLFAQQKALMEPTAFQWDEQAFRSKSESQSSIVRWPDMVRWAETDRAVLLFANDLMFYVLPQRALTPDSRASLIAQLTANGVPQWRRWRHWRKPVRQVGLAGG